MGARQSTPSSSSSTNTNVNGGSPSRILQHNQQQHLNDNLFIMGNINTTTTTTTSSSSSSSSTTATTCRNNNNNDNNDQILNNNNHNNTNNDNSNNLRQRARSLIFTGSSSSRPSHSSAIDFTATAATSTSSNDTLLSNNDLDVDIVGLSFMPFSLPIIPYNYNQIKCSGCSKIILRDELRFHLMCYKLPFNYNEDILTENKDECIICLEEMKCGDKIARLPCLCIYHKKCIDAWFNVNRSCPEHPTVQV